MSTIIDTARALMAIMQPITGNRATGVATVTASGADVTLPMNTYAMPVINGDLMTSLLLKTTEGPNDDKSWTVTSGGTVIGFTSVTGGVRYNIAQDTEIVFDPPISGLVSTRPTANSAFSNGTDPTFWGSVKDIVIYENFEPTFMMQLRRSNVTIYPCVLITWINGEPADGSTIAQTHQATRTGFRRKLWKDTYAVTVVSSREESDHARRHEGLEIIERLMGLLTDRNNVDNIIFSSPSGVQIRSYNRISLPQTERSRFYIYTITLSTERALVQTDSRTWNDWLLAVIDVIKPQDPPLPNEGDFTIVDDMEVDMS